MNKKGFTLIELLAVIIILSTISLIVVGGINASLERRDEKELSEQQELAIGAAKIYFSLNNTSCVSIKTLIDQNYFGSPYKVDRLNENFTIRLSSNKYVYSSTGC